MDVFCKKLSEVFKLKNLDIETLKVKDAKMPLYIVASNITKGVPTIFTGDVLLIDAIRCSCCLPVVYRPQELYGQLYIDGDAFLPYIGSLHKDALVLSLKTHWDKISLKTYEDMSLFTYIRVVYNLGVMNIIELHKTDLTVELGYPKLLAESNLDDFDLRHVFKIAGDSIRSFLVSKGFLEELPEVIDSGST